LLLAYKYMIRSVFYPTFTNYAYFLTVLNVKVYSSFTFLLKRNIRKRK
jgi:hypothetical protein